MLLVFLGLVIMVIVVYKLYERVYVPNVTLDSEAELLYIPTGSDFEYVIDHLEDQAKCVAGKGSVAYRNRDG